MKNLWCKYTEVVVEVGEHKFCETHKVECKKATLNGNEHCPEHQVVKIWP